MSSLDRRCVRRLCRDPAPKKEKNTRHCSKETYIDCIIVFSATSRKADVVYGHPTSGIPCNRYMKPYYWGMIVTMAHLCSSARCYSAGAGKPSRHHQRWLHGVALRLLQHHQSDLELWTWVWNLEANACCRSCLQIGASCSFQHVAKMWDDVGLKILSGCICWGWTWSSSGTRVRVSWPLLDSPSLCAHWDLVSL